MIPEPDVVPAIPWTWRVREPPIAPCAVLALGEVSRRLARRLLTLTRVHLARLRGVAGVDLLLVLGAAEDLPWVDGVGYLGVDPEAPRLLLPTTEAPELHPALLQRALLRPDASDPARQAPLAVLPSGLLVAARLAEELSPARIASWLAETET